jgi:hypothetical protein
MKRGGPPEPNRDRVVLRLPLKDSDEALPCAAWRAE